MPRPAGPRTARDRADVLGGAFIGLAALLFGAVVILGKVVTDDGSSYWLRPSFVTGYMTGTVDELAYPLLLASHGVPPGC